MLPVLKWIIEALEEEKIKCHKCQEVFVSKSVVAIGIRESYQQSNKEYLFVELICSKCKKATLFELREMSLIEFSFEILDDQEFRIEEKIRQGEEKLSSFSSLTEEQFEEKSIEEAKKNVENSFNTNFERRRKRRIKKSRITQKEVRDSVRFLNSIKSHEEFLISLGMSFQEIEKYQYKKKKKKLENE
ncbi:MAG TPA: hypothetical protein VMZ91_12900 [Candidatus Paceibacterota bacterium]|nr:hypothetical protein [Candidatus Paceibacterota bacterium]